MDAIRKAAKIISKGGVVAIPTDTVYGLVADALNERSVKRIYELKRRPPDKPLVLFVKDLAEAQKFAEFSEDALKLALKFWPGPLTLIVKAKPYAPKTLVTPKGTIGLRIPNDSVVMALLDIAKMPLASTSANLSGMPPAKDSTEVRHQMPQQPDYVINGVAGGKPPSTVIDFSQEQPVILRKGPISIPQIENTIGKEVKLSKHLDLRIFFVCTGNIYRSKMAELILKDLLPKDLHGKVLVRSGGLHAPHGIPIPEDVRILLREMGIHAPDDSHAHQINEADIEWADIIYCMEQRHLEKLREYEGGHKAKLLNSHDIPDPLGHSLPFIRLVRDGICRILKNEIVPYIIRKFDE